MFSLVRLHIPTESRMLSLPFRALACPRHRLISTASSVSLIASRPRSLASRPQTAPPRVPLANSASYCMYTRSYTSYPPPASAPQNTNNMASNAFTRAVVEDMQTMYPEELADRAWDNVGLLLENSTLPTDKPGRERVLLTNDLTPDVVDEAIAYKASVIVAYHPIIFRGLKSLTLKDPQQASLLKLMQNNIAVYSPHTALDAGVDGINDWLADTVAKAGRTLGSTGADISVLKSVKDRMPSFYKPVDAEGTPLDVGYGRHIRLSKLVQAPELIKQVVKEMGLSMSHVLVARPRAQSAPWWGNLDSVMNVGVCAGSGFDIFRDKIDQFNMIITGEVSHHDALYATTRNVWVVCLLHSNSERKFLSAKLQDQLTRQLTQHHAYKDAVVLVSERDRDPFEFWDIENPPSRRTSDRPEAFTV